MVESLNRQEAKLVKRKNKNMTSKQQAKKLISNIGDEALKKAKQQVKNAKSTKDEVYWRAVVYHINQENNDRN